MIHMHDEGVIQKRAFIKRVTGIELRMKPMDEIDKMKVDLDAGVIVIKLITHTFQERRQSTIITGRGVRLISYQRNADGRWYGGQAMETMWEEDFKPIVMPHYEHKPRSLADDVQQRTWERMAGRTGAGRTPMDTYSRVEQGYSTERMIKHWN